MKNLIKSFIKVLYVIVIPIMYAWSAYYAVTTYDLGTAYIITLLLVGVAVALNSVVYMSILAKTKMLPKLQVEFIPIIGVAFGVDPNSSHKEMSWSLLLPFISFEFRVKK